MSTVNAKVRTGKILKSLRQFDKMARPMALKVKCREYVS